MKGPEMLGRTVRVLHPESLVPGGRIGRVVGASDGQEEPEFVLEAFAPDLGEFFIRGSLSELSRYLEVPCPKPC